MVSAETIRHKDIRKKVKLTGRPAMPSFSDGSFRHLSVQRGTNLPGRIIGCNNNPGLVCKCHVPYKHFHSLSVDSHNVLKGQHSRSYFSHLTDKEAEVLNESLSDLLKVTQLVGSGSEMDPSGSSELGAGKQCGVPLTTH